MSNSDKRASIAAVVRDFMKLESASGILLLIAAILAVIVANSPLAYLYGVLLDTPVAVQIGGLKIHKPLLLWINDGLMAIFFFLIGLEFKREIMDGELSSLSQIILPGVGAIGGMVVPAAIYAGMNWGDPIALNGWAIPVATDIAFALGLLSVFGSRVPTALKVFLLSLAIFDDLGAIVIIALFYSGELSPLSLLIATVALIIGVVMNRSGVTRTASYVLLGVVVWVAVLKSGVHATLAGVLIAFSIPMRDERGHSPLRELEHNLHGPVAFAILPIFAFANAGLSLAGMSLDQVAHPVTMGVILGLFVGKPLGILLFVWLAILLRIACLPAKVRWSQIVAVGCACGIGFTMSFFIAGLAFEDSSRGYVGVGRLGILVGSILSATLAYVLLQVSLPKTRRAG